MADLTPVLAALSDALAAASGVAATDDLAPITKTAAAAEKRHGFLGETVVVALAGGTGSGKSSLLNALAGAEVSKVGAVRPTTAEPLAWIPANPEPGLMRLLDDLGLHRRVGHDHHLPVAVIDLPDYDSVEFEHRATVESLIPRVDAIIWVLDPQKYSDRALHRDYLIPLAGYAEQFLFVLNQVDRLDEPGLAAVLDDLTRRLTSEGFAAPRIVTTAARPVAGHARGIDTLTREVAQRFESKRTAHAKLLEDVRRAHTRLVELTGLAVGPGASSAGQWEDSKQTAVGGLVDLVAGSEVTEQATRVGERLATARAAGPIGRLGAVLRRSRLGKALGAAPDEVKPGEWWAQPGLERLLAGLSRAVTEVSTGLGGELGRGLRAELTPENLESSLRAAVEGARHEAGELGPPAPKRWWGLVGAVQLALFVALVAGIAWVWVDGVDRGQVPWNLILIGGSVVLATVLGVAARASGRRAGQRRATSFRADIERSLTVQIDERIGGPVTRAVAVRDRLVAAVARLEKELSPGPKLNGG